MPSASVKKQEDLLKHSSILPTPVYSDNSGMSEVPCAWSELIQNLWLLCFPACRCKRCPYQRPAASTALTLRV